MFIGQKIFLIKFKKRPLRSLFLQILVPSSVLRHFGGKRCVSVLFVTMRCAERKGTSMMLAT